MNCGAIGTERSGTSRDKSGRHRPFHAGGGGARRAAMDSSLEALVTGAER